MANEEKKDFNAMLNDSKDMPKIQIITDEKSILKYGGDRMYFAPPMDYDRVMRLVPFGKLLTVGAIREYFARQSGADFTEPITAGIFVSIAAWASFQRTDRRTPYWRTLKAGGELNAKFPGGIEAQKELLEKEGHTVIQKGRTNIRYYVSSSCDSGQRDGRLGPTGAGCSTWEAPLAEKRGLPRATARHPTFSPRQPALFLKLRYCLSVMKSSLATGAVKRKSTSPMAFRAACLMVISPN